MSTFYEPRFDNQHVLAVAQRRGLLAPDESVSAGLDRVGRELARIDARLGGTVEFAGELSDALHAGRVAVSSQLFAAAGRSAAVAACTVLPVTGSTDATRLRRAVAQAAVASEAGMGCGIDVSEFDDPARAAIDINDALRAVHASLIARNLRPPALMISCRADHRLIAEFARVKHSADFSGWVANISVRFSGSDDAWSRLRPLLAAEAHHNGEPGILFQDAADADNPTPEIRLTSTAPCAEVFLSPGERCVFVSVNLAAHVSESGFDWSAFVRSVRLAVRAADAAVELAADGADSVVTARRRVGVGVCGYHSALIWLGIPYARSAGFAARVAETLTFAAHRASADLASVRGPFPLFSQSRWTDQAWVRRKRHRLVGAVRPGDWAQLDKSIAETGVRNAAVVSYPPTGVVAEILGVSRSYEPHFTLVGQTGVASKFETAIVPEVDAAITAGAAPGSLRRALLDPAYGHQVPGAPSKNLLACARQLPPEIHLAVHASFSALADEAGSKTVNLPAAATAQQVEALFDAARDAGLKGMTVFRDGCLSERMVAA